MPEITRWPGMSAAATNDERPAYASPYQQLLWELADERAAHERTREMVGMRTQQYENALQIASIRLVRLDAALALLRDVAKAGNLAPAQVAELQRLEGKGNEFNETTTTNSQPGEEGANATV